MVAPADAIAEIDAALSQDAAIGTTTRGTYPPHQSERARVGRHLLRIGACPCEDRERVGPRATSALLLAVCPSDEADPRASESLDTRFATPPASGWVPSAGLRIPVGDLLKYVIEGYLLKDLESMAGEISPKEIGACGYPMVMAVLSGSELLGKLVSDEGDRITAYWDAFMAKVDNRYGYLGGIASKLARNGIAHSYLSHYGVLVVRDQPARHLSLAEESGEVVFDCIELHRDFRKSYEAHARQHVLGNPKDAQRRLDSLVQHDAVKAESLMAKLPREQFPQTSQSGSQPATPTHLRTETEP